MLSSVTLSGGSFILVCNTKNNYFSALYKIIFPLLTASGGHVARWLKNMKGGMISIFFMIVVKMKGKVLT